MDTNLAIDLSIRSTSPKGKCLVTYEVKDHNVPVVRPIPRPPWAITWYQSLWSVNQHHVNLHASPHVGYPISRSQNSSQSTKIVQKPTASSRQISPGPNNKLCKENFKDLRTTTNYSTSQTDAVDETRPCTKTPSSVGTIVDVACCDGPVTFERILNPNFALTVEHIDSSASPNDDNISKPTEPKRHLTLKTYMCIYCNQTFKSLFCYQKHKKRHLNPVSVDITATHAPSININPEKKAKTRDLNVQFFPCKKCGSKFPSYYFVHKHRKVCH